MKRFAVAAVPWAAALLLRAWADLSSASVERLYSRGAFPVIARVLDGLSSWTALSLAELLGAGILLVGLAIACTRARRWRKDGTRPRFARVLAWLILLSGLGYLTFLLMWGLNYARPPLAALLGLDVRPSSRDELFELSAELVGGANRARDGLPEDGAGALRLVPTRAAAVGAVALGFDALQGIAPLSSRASARVKTPFSSPLLSYMGVAGIYIPYTGEPNLNGTLPDSEIPFTAAHEMAHRHGFAREDEANYVGYLACRAHPDPAFRYSGALRASLYAVAALHGVDPAAAQGLQAGRSAPVRRDLLALADWHRRYESRASLVQRRVNDAYLRSQGQADGVHSYGRMVDLLLAERRAQRTGMPEPHPPAGTIDIDFTRRRGAGLSP